MKRIYRVGAVVFFMGAVVLQAAVLEVGKTGYTYSTIQSAVTVARAGDVINVHAGRYNESVSFYSSGTTDNYITLRAADGEEAIMDGAVALTGWTQCASAAECGGNPNWQNIYYTTTATMIPLWPLGSQVSSMRT